MKSRLGKRDVEQLEQKFDCRIYDLNYNSKNDAVEFWFQKDNLFIRVAEGTGDSLLPEDVEEGYVDYLMYDVYNSLQDIREDNIYDGGQIMLRTLYCNFTFSEILEKAIDMIFGLYSE